MKKLLLLFAVIFTVLNAVISQPFSDEAYYVYTLGKDTSMVGTCKIKDREFEVTVLSREFATVYKQKGKLFDNGELESLEGISYKVAYGKQAFDKRSYRLYYKNDSTHVEISDGEKTYPFIYKGKAVVNNMVGHTAFFLYSFWALYSPKIGDSLVSQHMWWKEPLKYVLRRTGKNTMRVGSTLMGFLTLHLDDAGKLKSIDAMGSSLNFIGHRHPFRNMDSVINDFTQREYFLGPVGTNTKPDSVNTVINGVHFKLYYNAPSMRGRKIFGNVVPYNRFWRTGANQSTTLIIDKPVYIEGKKLEPGRYSLFTLPSENSWTLMINTDTGIWGTQYNPDHDILRATMKASTVNIPLETLKISLLPSGKDAMLQISWENTRAEILVSF